MSVPPEDEQLRFARNTKTGRVHIMASVGSDGCEAIRGLSADEIIEGLLSRHRMLCGRSLLTGPFPDWPAVFTGGDKFDDGDLCAGCVQALGNQSWRAFHCDNRGPFDVMERGDDDRLGQ